MRCVPLRCVPLRWRQGAGEVCVTEGPIASPFTGLQWQQRLIMKYSYRHSVSALNIGKYTNESTQPEKICASLSVCVCEHLCICVLSGFCVCE